LPQVCVVVHGCKGANSQHALPVSVLLERRRHGGWSMEGGGVEGVTRESVIGVMVS
jgi:hypothetical protein